MTEPTVKNDVSLPAADATPDPWHGLSRFTPARIGLGRAGGSLPTREVLRFGLEHARARDSVHLPFDGDGLVRDIAGLGLEVLAVASAATSREDYLRRPDLGRRLSAESRKTLEDRNAEAADLAIVVADGLSSAALHAHAVDVLKALMPHLERAGARLAPVTVATGARVALGDEIGEVLHARAVAVLIGERPGLSSPDSLGVYVTLAPKVGRTDAERNCISNIRRAGLSPDKAASKLSWLLERAFALNLTGVGLKDESDAVIPLGGAPALSVDPTPVA